MLIDPAVLMQMLVWLRILMLVTLRDPQLEAHLLVPYRAVLPLRTSCSHGAQLASLPAAAMGYPAGFTAVMIDFMQGFYVETRIFAKKPSHG